MFQLQKLPARRRPAFDGTRYAAELRHGDSTTIEAPEGIHFVRLRLAGPDHPASLIISGSAVVGESATIELRAGWHSYFVPVSGPAIGFLKFSGEDGRRIGERLGMRVSSLAVVDAAQRNREEAADPPRVQLPRHEDAAGPIVVGPGGRASDDYLDTVEKSWEFYGRTDPLFYILTDDSKKDHGWPLDEFVNIGAHEIAGALDWVESQNIPLRRRVALDFGCGVGRLSQALARHFDQVHGIDIAQSMVDSARRLNVYGRRVVYHHSNSQQLPFPERTFDFIYTNIVLQHVRPEYTRNYLDQFVRLLAPGGVLMFQLPSAPLLNWQGIKLRFLPEKNWHPQATGNFTARMEFHWIHRRRVLRQFAKLPVRVHDVQKDFITLAYSFRYCVRRLPEAQTQYRSRAA